MTESLFNKSDLKILPLEEAETIPSSWYTDHNIYNFELKNILSKSWNLVSHVSKIKSKGDFVVENLFGNSIIIVRSGDDEINAFYNVCRHRGGPIAAENGSCKIFQCKYHGWTYQLDGSLRGTPKFDGVKNFNSKEYSLKILPVLIVKGMIFISLQESPLQDNYIADIFENGLVKEKIEKFNFYTRVNYKIKCNWKVYIDNFLEGYHLPYVHPGLSKIISSKEYKIETGEYHSLQSSLIIDDTIYGNGEAFYYFIYPNMMLNILPGRLQTNLVLPLSEEQTLVIFDYFYDDISTRNSEKISNDIRFSEEIQQEDINICERVQNGLKSFGYDRGRFSVQEEAAVHHFQNLLRKNIHQIIRR